MTSAGHQVEAAQRGRGLQGNQGLDMESQGVTSGESEISALLALKVP